MNARAARHPTDTTNLLTYKIIGFANVIVPNSHLKGFLAQFCILNLIEELLCKNKEINETPIIAHMLLNRGIQEVNNNTVARKELERSFKIVKSRNNYHSSRE